MTDNFKNIETVEDYLKFKETLNRSVQNTGRAQGVYQDFFNEKPLKSNDNSDFDLGIYKSRQIKESLYMENPPYQSYKENIIPKELKDESMLESSFLNMLNIKKPMSNIKNLIEIEPNPVTIRDSGLRNLLGDVDKLITKTNLTKSTKNPEKNYFNKLKIDRPDLKANYMDNNDIRNYLNSLNIKPEPQSKKKEEENKSHIKPKKDHKKNKKNPNLSIIEDDLEGELEDSHFVEKKTKKTKTKKNKKTPSLSISSDSDSDSISPIKKKKKTKKTDNEKIKKINNEKQKKIDYEEDLTKNLSEKEVSLHSASHFNEKYLRKKIVSEHSQLSRELSNKSDYKIQRDLLDEITEVLCVDCEELINMNCVDTHSKVCNKKLTSVDTIPLINAKLRKFITLIRTKTKKIKEILDENQGIIAFIQMIVDCIEQIIENNNNIIKLVGNIKDLSAFNKTLNENENCLLKTVLEISFRVKPIAKMKIPLINENLDWAQAKNLREKSIYSQNLKKSTVSIKQSQNLVSINSKITQNYDQKLKKFMKIAINIKLGLDRSHPARNQNLEELYKETENLKLNENEWEGYIDHFFKNCII